MILSTLFKRAISPFQAVRQVNPLVWIMIGVFSLLIPNLALAQRKRDRPNATAKNKSKDEAEFKRNINLFGGFGWAPSTGGTITTDGGVQNFNYDVKYPYNDSTISVTQTPFYMREGIQNIVFQLGVAYQPGYFFTGGPFIKLNLPVGATRVSTSYFYEGQFLKPDMPQRIDNAIEINRWPTIMVGLRGKFSLFKDRKIIPYIPAEFCFVFTGSNIKETLTHSYLDGRVNQTFTNNSYSVNDYLTGSFGLGCQYNFDYYGKYSVYAELGFTMFENSIFAGSGIVHTESAEWDQRPYRSWKYETNRFQFFFQVGFQWSFFQH